jgi:uncharacterized protein YciI
MICVEFAYANPDPVRQERRAAHRERLQHLVASGDLFAAGPWPDDSGAMIIFDTDDESRALQLIADDPYFQAPGVSLISIRGWNAITPDDHGRRRGSDGELAAELGDVALGADVVLRDRDRALTVGIHVDHEG